MKSLLASLATALCLMFSANAGGQTGVAPRVPPYSYYAAFPLPARQYVGYGTNDFPFYGKPYGYPYDSWSWTSLSGAPHRGLARYYYPPLR